MGNHGEIDGFSERERLAFKWCRFGGPEASGARVIEASVLVVLPSLTMTTGPSSPVP